MPERYLSPSMHDEDALSLLIAPLVGVEARIYNDLWNAVIDRKLRPGTKLEESSLCEIFGVSRTVVRKVLLIMEQEGIVTLPLNRGAYVVFPSPREAAELGEAVIANMSFIASRLAGNADGISLSDREKLEAHLEAERQAHAAHDFHTMRRYRIEFVTLIALVYGNKILASAIERNSVRYAIALAAYEEGPSIDRALAFAEGFVKLILGGDATGAVALLEGYMAFVQKTMRFDVANDTLDLKAILGVKS